MDGDGKAIARDQYRTGLYLLKTRLVLDLDSTIWEVVRPILTTYRMSETDTTTNATPEDSNNTSIPGITYKRLFGFTVFVLMAIFMSISVPSALHSLEYATVIETPFLLWMICRLIGTIPPLLCYQATNWEWELNRFVTNSVTFLVQMATFPDRWRC